MLNSRRGRCRVGNISLSIEVYNHIGVALSNLLGTFHDLQKLTDRSPLTQRLNPDRGIGPPKTSPTRGEFHFCGQTLSPVSFGFIGLMIAIVLWGTSYKLSLYCPHPAHSSRTQVAKLWIEPRSTSMASIRGLKGTSSRVIGGQAFAASNQFLLNLDHAAVFPNGRFDQDIRTSACLIPSRAPPSFLFCLG